MNFEVNDVTAKILEEFQDAIDDALGNIKDKQDEQNETLKILQEKVNQFDLQKDLTVIGDEVKKNQEQINIMMEKIEILNKNISAIQLQLEKNDSLLQRIAMRSRRLR